MAQKRVHHERRESMARSEVRYTVDMPDPLTLTAVLGLGGPAAITAAAFATSHRSGPWPWERLSWEFEVGGSPLAIANYLVGTARAATRPANLVHTVHRTLPRECPRVLGPEWRNRWHLIGDQWCHVDHEGRPDGAVLRLRGSRPSKRKGHAQLRVGRWGDAEVWGDDDEGGHAAPSHGGGSGCRAGLVPMDKGVNRGLWRVFEREVIALSSRQPGRWVWVSRFLYRSDSIRPHRLGVSLVDLQDQRSRYIEIWNGYRGGPLAALAKAHALEFLRRDSRTRRLRRKKK